MVQTLENDIAHTVLQPAKDAIKAFVRRATRVRRCAWRRPSPSTSVRSILFYHDGGFRTYHDPLRHNRLNAGLFRPRMDHARPHEAFERIYPNYALPFAWNHTEEIHAKETRHVAIGSKWID